MVNMRKAAGNATLDEATLATTAPLGGETTSPEALPAGYTDQLTEGRIVHYTLPDGPNAGAHRPAIVVRVWDKQHGTCNLQVFTDEINDGFSQPVTWRTSIRPDPTGRARSTWHFPEKAGAQTSAAKAGGTATPDDPDKSGGQT